MLNHNNSNALQKPLSPDAFVPQQSTQARYEVITRPNLNFGLSERGGGTKDNFERLIVPKEGEKTRKFTLNLTEAEIKRIQNLYDFLNSDGRDLKMSLDEMLRQIILQPQTHFLVCEFFGQYGNEVVSHVITNSPEGVNWY